MAAAARLDLHGGAGPAGSRGGGAGRVVQARGDPFPGGAAAAAAAEEGGGGERERIPDFVPIPVPTAGVHPDGIGRAVLYPVLCHPALHCVALRRCRQPLGWWVRVPEAT